jgi:hypothetical protein
MSLVTRRLGLIGALAAMALGMSAVSAFAATTQPIVGVWNYQNGQIQVTQTSPGNYVGTVTQATVFSDCTHAVGDQIWTKITDTSTSGSYVGYHEWLYPSTDSPSNACQPYEKNGAPDPGNATWNVSSSGTSMTFCTAEPGHKNVIPGTFYTDCYALTLQTAASAEPAAPSNTGVPSISGTASVGDALKCSNGAWSNSPTGYEYKWLRDGTAIDGATDASYTVATADAGHTLTCQVIAANQGGFSQPSTSAGVRVQTGSGTPSGKGRASCPVATGKVSSRRLGLVTLGMTRTKARHVYRKSHDKKGRFNDLFCLTPHGVQVDYASTALLKTLSKKQGAKLRRRVVSVTTANHHYAIRGIRPGTSTLKTARRKLKLSGPIHVNHQTWYLARFGSSTAVLKVRGGRVREIGIADTALTRAKSTRQALLANLA